MFLPTVGAVNHQFPSLTRVPSINKGFSIDDIRSYICEPCGQNNFSNMSQISRPYNQETYPLAINVEIAFRFA